MRWIYAGLTRAGAVLAWLGLRIYSSFNPSWQDRFRQGFGHYPEGIRKSEPALLVHGASVGEVGLGLNIIASLREQGFGGDIFLSTMTTTGHRRAREEGGGLCEAIYFPFDSPPIVARALDALNPARVVLLETEIWPNFIRACHQRNIPILLVNGRLSSRSIRRYLRIKSFLREVLACLDGVYATSRLDAERFLGLGSPKDRTHVLGNAKYDSLPEKKAKTDLESVRQGYGIKPADWVFVAGSTRRGEEDQVLQAYRKIRQAIPECRFIWVPRHPQFTFQIEQVLRQAGIPYQLRSALRLNEPATAKVVLVDRIGELLALYGLADAAFSGGSLIHRGGHNFLEIAIWNKPPITGPSYDDFQDAFDWLEELGAVFLVRNPEELADRVIRIYRDAAEGERFAARLGKAWRHREAVSARIARVILEGLA